jgi:hypothetical protein
MDLRGTFWVLFLYDVSEEIRLEQLRGILGAGPAAREPSFSRPTPDYVRFQRPPVVESLAPIDLASGEHLEGRVKYYDFGVVSVELRFDFHTGWESLVQLTSRWISAPEVEKRAAELARTHVDRARPALGKPWPEWLSEDYYIIQLREALEPDGSALTARELLARHGPDIAKVIRGESAALAEGEQQEALNSSISYFPTDLFVAGWQAALVYDTPAAAAPFIQLLEYANTQLLEFRHYDDVLTLLLAQVYQTLERKDNLWHRWRLAREAERLNTIRLDVRELTERSDNAIKFLSDMYYARAYRLAAQKVGVNDYRGLVEEKLRTAGDLYFFMVNEFHQARAFVLEAMVVAILVIELVYLFRGKG